MPSKRYYRRIATLCITMGLVSACEVGSPPSNARAERATTVAPARTTEPTAAVAPTLELTAPPTPEPTAPPTPEPTPAPQAIVQTDSLRVREGPGTNYPIRTHVNAADTLHVVGRANTLPWVKVVLPDTSEGWVSAQPEHVQLSSAIENLPVAYFQPPSSVIQGDEQRIGLGELHIENGTQSDTVLILSRDDATLIAAYVRAGETLTIDRIPDGTYVVFATSGQDWDGLMFNTDRSNERFQDSLLFSTTTSQYSIWTLTLQPVIGGNAQSAPISASDLPAISPGNEVP